MNELARKAPICITLLDIVQIQLYRNYFRGEGVDGTAVGKPFLHKQSYIEERKNTRKPFSPKPNGQFQPNLL
jgi:hypothetical protein